MDHSQPLQTRTVSTSTPERKQHHSTCLPKTCSASRATTSWLWSKGGRFRLQHRSFGFLRFTLFKDPRLCSRGARFFEHLVHNCHERTQVMLRNLPNNYTREMLMSLLDRLGLAGGNNGIISCKSAQLDSKKSCSRIENWAP